MPEFLGTKEAVAIQQRLQKRQPLIAKTPELANGGRLLHCLEPDMAEWPRVRAMAREDGLIGFPLVRLDLAIGRVREKLGTHWKTMVWHAFAGLRDPVMEACGKVLADVQLPDDWQVHHSDCPSDTQIGVIQGLNAQTGVAPYPAYYMRSEAVPVLTTCIHDGTGSLVATASVADRYHPQGRLGGHVFAGMVSVAEVCRGQGLGKLVNALALIESQTRFGWRVATEQVALDNHASRAMIEACGLDHSEGLSSVVGTRGEGAFTR